MNQLEQLKRYTKVVADTGEFASIAKFHPQDATTNPTLVLTAIQQPTYQKLLVEAVDFAKTQAKSGKLNSTQQRTLACDRVLINFGVEILKLIPGRVSTEVDARLSFNQQGSVDKARALIKLYQAAGIPKERILIKLASTWEGIQAATILEKEGIHCNMTLMFSVVQAAACAEAHATLISPFVGRILDWYKKAEGVAGYPPDKDPGVKSVTEIYHYLKKFGYKTEVMGASFRNREQIVALAGCDLLTISPKFLGELEASTEPVPRCLSLEQAKSSSIEKLQLNEEHFRYLLNDNAMATDKLSEGIRLFAHDSIKLEQLIASQIGA